MSDLTISASQRGPRGRVEFRVTWTDADGTWSQLGYRTLEDAMRFCPCSMNPDTVKRIVIPGVTRT